MQNTAPTQVLRKALIIMAIEVVVTGAIFFATAGTIDWVEAWLFLSLFGFMTLLATFGLARHNPALLDERTKPMAQDQPLWDKIMMVGIMVLIAIWMIVPGLDAIRFGWSSVPMWLKIIGAAGFVISYYGMYHTMIENSFLVPNVRFQDEREQQVVTTGSYAIVRHPFYAMLILLFLFGSLLLGSWLAVADTGALSIWLAIRILGEERLLAADLDGYRDYQQQTRYRLIPGIW
ncbi:Protein-S-isoprenylcysteine O-methyltransferase Ste14 [Shimia gijangensis]|uniref:Protein-S-isoprenylcysteine O-methyltransferase Ste14 n=1 Tax=Shimia gijangensis TaxID=1470563 RepID=A0A1M6NCA8_9RHOB|nr:isoprenylcysteine carboxylmethyltransferase family protein [Shimia gijangensis]SHJ93263.1 Protein-S-isoprenylcysteine O-methyltransferase Ste14 [Shimia gijangensis]